MNYTKLELAIKCKCSNLNNCFLHLHEKYRDILNENDIVLLKSDTTSAYVSIFFSNIGRKNEECMYIDRLYATKLGFEENQDLLLIKSNKELKFASSINIQPLSVDDLQILELNVDNIQDNLLNQIRVVYKNQIFPIWIESSVCIFVKVYSIKPDNVSFVCLNQMTKVEVNTESIGRQQVEDKNINANGYPKSVFDCSQMKNYNYTNESALNSYLSLLKWSFKARVVKDVSQNHICSTLTTIRTSKRVFKKFGIEIVDEKKFLVKIEHMNSPMSASTNKDLLKRLAQVVENSYHEDYIQNLTNKMTKEYYALLDIRLDNESNDSVEVSEFLMNQMGLNSFSQVKISCLSKEDVLENANKKKILRIKSSHPHVNDILNSFEQLIDENSICLCPIVLTNQEIFEVSCKKISNNTKRIKFQIESSEPFLALNSNIFANSSIHYEIDSNPSYEDIELRKDFTDIKQLELNLVQSSWFKYHVSLLDDHLYTHLNTKNTLSRNIIIQGSKGSGKTTLSKYICNKYSSNTFYQYVNCQNLMGKSIDSINELLNLIFNEASWCGNSIVVLDNIDLLIENVNSETDSISRLYCHQLIEILKEILVGAWSKSNSKVVTLATSTASLSELPSLFHCLDNHGIFTSFASIRPSTKQETFELVQRLIETRRVQFENDLIETIVDKTDNFVIKDIDKLIDKILFEKWSQNPMDSSRLVKLVDVKSILDDYKSMNTQGENYFKPKNAIDWQMIGGLQDAKRSLIETILWPIKHENLYKKLNMKQFSAVLLYGPSGCGKTLVASALANQSKLNFISVKGPELLSKYIGTSEQNVRELFRRAERARPCVIFFDEFDSLAPKRGHDSTGVTDRVVNQLLTELDGVEQLSGVYLIAASSRPDLIDSALLRPGRIDKHIYIGYPNEQELSEMMRLYGAKIKLNDSINFDELSKECVYFTGADVKSIMCDALLKAFHRLYDDIEINNDEFYMDPLKSDKSIIDKIQVTQEDLLSSIRNTKKTINISERVRSSQMYENWSNTKRLSDGTFKKSRATLA